MSLIGPVEVKCYMCGAVNEYEEMLSTNCCGSTDLDTRPPEMERSTMHTWVHVCPECGYASHDVSDESSIDASFLTAEEYRSCDGIPFASDLAKGFYRYHMILTTEQKGEKAFWALLRAAWACDDAKDVSGAVTVREKAIRLADHLRESDDIRDREIFSLIRADLLRRAAHFSELLDQYAAIRFTEELHNQILDFQKVLARMRCSACFTVRDAVEYLEGTAEKREIILGKRDELFVSAVELLIRDGESSVPELQTKLRIGYARANRLLKAMENLAVVERQTRGRYKCRYSMDKWKLMREYILSDF